MQYAINIRHIVLTFFSQASSVKTANFPRKSYLSHLNLQPDSGLHAQNKNFPVWPWHSRWCLSWMVLKYQRFQKNGTVFCLKELVTHRVDIYNMLGSYEVFGQASRSWLMPLFHFFLIRTHGWLVWENRPDLFSHFTVHNFMNTSPRPLDILITFPLESIQNENQTS